MSIRETVLRYESIPRKNPGIQSQIELHKKNEKYRDLLEYVRVLEEERKVAVRTNHLEHVERKVTQGKMENTTKQCDAEIRQATKATIMVRRRALEVQLQREMDQYNQELAAVGKTFRTERI